MKDLFDATNKHIMTIDPYRPDEDCPIYEKYFDEDGEFSYEFRRELVNYIIEHNCSWNSDPVSLYHAKVFSGNTKGNYTTAYYWR